MLELPIITRYVSEGPAKLSLAYASGWDIPICRSLNNGFPIRSNQPLRSIPRIVGGNKTFPQCPPLRPRFY